MENTDAVAKPTGISTFWRRPNTAMEAMSNAPIAPQINGFFFKGWLLPRARGV